MKLLKTVTNLAIATAAIVSFSFAQASIITTTSDSVAAGSPATIHLDWNAEGASDYRSVSADLQFDDSVLTSFNLDDCPAAGYTTSDGYFAANCTDQTGGVIRTGWALVSGGVPTGRLGTIVFQTDPNATPGDYDISFLSVTVDQAPPTEVVGTVTILPPPEPDWSSTPNSATGLNFGSHSTDTGEYPFDLVVTNAGADGSTLTGTCLLAGSAVFNIPGDNTLGTGLAAGASANITPECDTTSAAVQLHTGTMSCTHNGDGTTETSVTDYALSCNVTAAPEPFYGDSLSPNPMDLVAVEEGDTNPLGTLQVSNSGDAAMNLTCTYAGDSQISTTLDGTPVLVGIDSLVEIQVGCDATNEGLYSGSISCAHDASNVASPVVYPATCDVGPPGNAVYESDPVPGSTIDMTPDSPELIGSVIPTQDLVITNNPPETNDRDLDLLNCGMLGMGAITATAPTTPLAPGASTTVTFSCNSATVGDFVETYSCAYDVDGDGSADDTATYTVTCGVRLAESEVTTTPADGTTVTIFAPLGGAGQGSVLFSEVLDEDEDGTLNDCFLDDETYFSILSPASFPQTISSGASVEVLVDGMGTPDGEPTSTMLNCDYTDSQNVSTPVSWPLEVVVQAAGIPTLSTWGLMLMILSLLGLGGLVIRRKEHS